MKKLAPLKKLFSNLVKDDCFNNAAAIAYYFILSSIPVIFLISTAIGFFTGSDSAVMKKLYTIIYPYVPNLSYDLWQKLTGWISRTSHGLNALSTITLVFSSLLIFGAINKSLKDVFHSHGMKNRSSLEALVIYVCLVIMLAVLVFLYMSIDVLLLLIKRLSRTVDIQFLKFFTSRISLILNVVPLLLQIANIAIVFRMFLGKNVSLSKIIKASFFIVVMWTAAIKAFSLYVNYIPTYNVIYGPMSIFIVFITWSYYSAIIFLVGAEMLKMSIEHEK